MNRLNILFLCATLLLGACGGGTPVYKDASQPVERRVNDLLKRMTVEEKAAQMDMANAASILDAATGQISSEKMDSMMKHNTLGSIHDLYPVSATVCNDIHKYVRENTRLGIPPIMIEEGLHGYQGAGSTTFPIPLGNACTWDTTLMYRIGKAIATEARAHGIHLILGPNLDLAREPRWGRVEETFGEDMYLSSRMAVNIVKGMQGESLKDGDAVIAEPKHFGIHGIPENGSNLSPVYIGEREARATHLYIFEKAVREAGARGVMAAYHEIDGVPVAGNRWLLTDVLRNEWGFKGIVISDLGAIALQYDKHRTAASPEDAIVSSVNAGMNMQFYDYPHKKYAAAIVEGVKSGKISQATLDRAAGDVLRAKFELGLFDNPFTDTTLTGKVHHSPEHRQLAYDAARASIVLLKNDAATLPLKKDIRRIAVVGRLANISSLGGYSPSGAKGVTIIEALRKRFGDKVEIEWLNGDISPNFTDIPASVLAPQTKYVSQNMPLAEVAAGGEHGLFAEYFNNLDFSGAPAYTAIDPALSHYWHNLSPAPGVDMNSFTARFSGTITAPASGIYEISLIANNYGRLYLDGKLIIDNWDDRMTEITVTARVYLEKGRPVPIRSEYGKLSDFAGQRIKWKYVGGASLADINRATTQAAARADAVIVVIGESSDEVGEAKDRQHLSPNPIDVGMVRAAAASGKPVTTVLLNGRPLILNEVAEASQAIVEAWFPGEAGGEAVVDVLFGDCNPSGKLTMSFPKSEGQLPIYYSRKSSASRTSIDGSPDPLYAFGHGLSYSTFEYSNLSVSPESPTVRDAITVSLDVRNTSGTAGVETVQLYVRDVVSSVTTPVMALKGFARVRLEAGETRRVKMQLTPEHLSLINIDMKRVVEPGVFDLMLGSSSADIRLTKSINVEK
ncbi:MAG: glycoside hydrolase family 3 C-terminal domain-containing protein [Prevotellaceae bacterium]|jgi:beta-glucosidase|nr:glycoside hydrolase family 3 C-terminal domain-containing protein [Prevotellaceae bacterium]